MPDCITLIMDATWVRGCVNCLEYWMNAWTSPIDIAPEATRSPPTTAMMTKFRLPTNIISGWMIPEMNCARKLAWNNSSLTSSKRSSDACWCPYTFTRS